MSKDFTLTVLGSASGSPSLKRNPSAQTLSIQNRLFLIDCGEATQLALRKNKIKFQRIEHIFISHLHGDHYLGLAGLLGTFSLLGRTKDLHIYAPKGLKEVSLLHFKISGSHPTYRIIWHEISIKEKTMILDLKNMSVFAFPLSHRVECYGFLFKEKPKERHINGPRAKELKIPHYLLNDIKKGADYVDGDKSYPNESITHPPDPSYSYAYCSDTDFMPKLAEVLQGVDAIYHETTFMEKDKGLARKTKHSTAMEAATIAKNAGAKRLLMGHYSARYSDLKALENEARSVFPESFLVDDGDVIDLSNSDI